RRHQRSARSEAARDLRPSAREDPGGFEIVNAHHRSLALAVTLTAAAAAGFTSRPASADGDKAHTPWTGHLGGAGSSQYSALKQIDKPNVPQLEVAWTYTAGTGTLRFNPLVVDGVMYVLGANRSIVALDAATGKERWVHRNEGVVGDRGMTYWE